MRKQHARAVLSAIISINDAEATQTMKDALENVRDELEEKKRELRAKDAVIERKNAEIKNLKQAVSGRTNTKAPAELILAPGPRDDRSGTRARLHQLACNQHMAELFLGVSKHCHVQFLLPDDVAGSGPKLKARRKNQCRVVLRWSILQRLFSSMKEIVQAAFDSRAAPRNWLEFDPDCIPPTENANDSHLWWLKSTDPPAWQPYWIRRDRETPRVNAFEPHTNWHERMCRFFLRPVSGGQNPAVLLEWIEKWETLVLAALAAAKGQNIDQPMLPPGWERGHSIEDSICCVWITN